MAKDGANPGEKALTREERLAAQLRANLRRRKAQARAIAGEPTPASEETPGESTGATKSE